MRVGNLQRLLEAARSLPGDRDDDVRLPLVDSSSGGAPAGGTAPAAEELRRDLGALFRELAERTEPALSQALDVAARAWDQADVLSIMDERLRARVDRAAAACRLAAGAEDPATAAAGMEGALALGAVVGLVGLLERRLATLMRLRAGGGGALKEEGRPFLDVAAALRETARAWS